jgi:hypothetical protein
MRRSGTDAQSRLLAGDGSIDWLPLPDLDYPSVLAAIVDSERAASSCLSLSCQ